MSVIVKLFIASLFSIHQYIPDGDPKYKKYFTDVREATAEDVLPAAHETCRYLISVFVDAGLEVTLGSSENSFLSESLVGIMGGDQALSSVLDVLSTGQFAEKFAEHNIDPEDVKANIKNICSTNYSPLSFRPEDKQEIFDFIQSEIKVLSDVHLNSFGDYNYFGSVNIFDRTGVSLGTIDAVPRAWVPYEQMSPHLTLALLATEDEDFFEHKGVDSKAIARIVKQMLSGSKATGGSTVTMQLLKNMYFLNGPNSKYQELNSGSFSTLLRKVREWYWAWPYEKEHAKVLGDVSAKKYVLEMYYNLVEFGPRIQGVEQASYVYFSKGSSKLDLAEAAFITTLLKAPSTYSNPDNYVEFSEPRRNDYILNRSLAICERVLATSDESFPSVSISDIYKKICTDGRKAIDSEYIEASKAQPLPNWLRPSTAPVSTSLILVRNQISQWIKNNKFDPQNKPKEISIQTTIREPLQNIVFDVVRKKIDEYDIKTAPSLGNINPANDDTGRKAQFRISDIDQSLFSEINDLLAKNPKLETKHFPSIKFRPGKTMSSQTLDFQNITAYLSTFQQQPNGSTKILENTAEIDPLLTQILNDVEKSLLSKSKNVGDIYLISFNGLEFTVEPIQKYINEVLEVSDTDKAVMTSAVDRIFVRNRIISNALLRMDTVKPRAYMQVGVVSENGNLIDAKLDKINLIESHKNRASRFSFGDFFWIRPQNVNAEGQTQNTGSFLLDSPKLQAAVMVMDANTGEVLANFGGYDPLTSSFNRSTDAFRQAGSTLKPWIYFYALNKGFSPDDVLNNRYISFIVPGRSRPYVPKNYSSSLNGNISFTNSLVNSQNIGTYSLLQNPIWGPDWPSNLNELRSFFEMINLYETANDEVTIILGSQEITIEKLVSSFSFFANGSKILNPQYVKFVSDYKGQKLFDIEPSAITVPISKPESVFQLQTMMAETANTGTAGRVNSWVKKLSGGKYSESCYNDVIGVNKQTCFGGKTGTSNDGKDVWFIGVSKNFVIGVWVGYDDPRPIGGNATGGGLALPIFQDIVEQGEAFLPDIMPFIDSTMVPRNLQRRLVYGSLSCSDGTGNPMTIYTDLNSNQNRCNNVPASTNTTTKVPPKPEAQVEQTPSNSCVCFATDRGASINLRFNGQTYNNFTNFMSLEECNRRKGEIKSQSGRQVCP